MTTPAVSETRTSIDASPPRRPAPRPTGLEAVFHPRSIAVVGASERAGSLGRTVLSNLIDAGFGGSIWPVNIKGTPILGRETATNLRGLPSAPDLAVIVTPAPAVEGVIEECVSVGVPAAVIISAGFKELGDEGAALERRVLEIATRGGVRLIGPNCLGVMSPGARLNATFAGAMALPGRMAFLSQSGALCTALLDWSLSEQVGFSAFVSVGSMLDVGWAELIDYFGNDPGTDCLLAYMESVGDARGLLAAAREVALKKPIVVIKGGRTQQAAQAATSHTGALAGRDDVFDAAMRRVGVLRVKDLAELVQVAEVVSKQPRPRGRRLTIVTNAGGPGVLATDALVEGGGMLAPLSASTTEALNEVLPTCWSRRNPIDIIGDADPARFAKAVEIAANDPASDGLLVILTPQSMTDPLKTAEAVSPQLKGRKKTVLTSWMGGAAVKAANEHLNSASIPTFAYPDTAAKVFNHLCRYTDDLRNLYETPTVASDVSNIDGRIRLVRALLRDAESEGRTLLTEEEAKRVLHAYGIPVVPTFVATTVDDAAHRAAGLGYPVVLKLHSHTITHKSELDGVQLNLQSDRDVREAFHRIQESVQKRAGGRGFDGVTVQPMVARGGYEVILGSSHDPQFGPVILFGTGGTLVEVYRDRSMGLPPLNSTLARRLMEPTRIYQALKGVRGKPAVDLKTLERVIVSFSELLMEHPRIRECDINPLIATPNEILALDARIVLHPASTPDAAITPPAIRPFPIEYIRPVTLADGTSVLIRPIRLEDETPMVRFHQGLSETTIHQRYFGLTSVAERTDHARLIRVCLNDFDCQMAIVAQRSGSDEILGVARFSRARKSPVADFGLLVADAWQGKGVGGMLLAHLIDIGRREGVRRVVGDLLPDNARMAHLCRQMGFRLEHHPTDRLVRATLELVPPDSAASEDLIL